MKTTRTLAFLVCAPLLHAESFRDVRYLHKGDGDDRGGEVIGSLTVDTPGKKLVFQSSIPKKKKKKTPPPITLQINTDSITSVLYERTSRPRYVSALLIAWPLIFTKGKKHFITIQYNSDSIGKYAIFHLDKANFRAILGATEATTGRKIERSEEH